MAALSGFEEPMVADLRESLFDVNFDFPNPQNQVSLALSYYVDSVRNALLIIEQDYIEIRRRVLLLLQGFQESVCGTVDDDTLRQLFQEQIQKAITEILAIDSTANVS